MKAIKYLLALSACLLFTATYADINLETGQPSMNNGLIQTTSAPIVGVCTMEWAPVCGVDGITYGNACMAGSVEIASQGECNNTGTVGFCTMEWAPVCGVDGVTYGNACMAGNVEIAKEGECNNTFATAAEFEKAEGLTCNVATDGCNTFFVTVNGRIGAGTLMACLNQTTPAWSCVQRDSLIKFLNGQDLTDYFAIKAGRLTPEAIQIVRDAIQTFTDRFEFNDEKAINLEFLVTAIEAYKTNLMNQNTKNLQLKLDILSLLRFEAIREMNVLLAVGEPIPVSSINLEFTCDNNERFFVEIDGDTLTLNDNRTRRFYTLNRVESADGEKFQDEINVVWIKGNDATFTRNGQDFYTNCTVVN